MNTNNPKKLKMHKFISVLITLVGIALMTYMIIVESEPGAIPLLLIVVGAGCISSPDPELARSKRSHNR